MLPFSSLPRLSLDRLRNAEEPRQLLFDLLTFASFAPSVHNSQPWRVDMHTPNQCTIFLEKNIQLPHADPTGRGGFLALGAFIENYALAATCVGQHIETQIQKNGTSGAIRMETLRSSQTNTATRETNNLLLNAIRTRATSRGLFTPLPDVARVVQALSAPATTELSSLHFISDTARLKKIAELIREGTLLAYGDSAFCKEHADWLRPNWTFRQDGIPGYAIGIPTPLSFLVPFAIRHKDMRTKRADQEFAKASSTNLFAVLATADDSPSGWIAAGRRLERLLVDTTRLGLVQSPNAAAIEMGSLNKEVATLIETNGVPQLMIRIGVGTSPRHLTPRRPVADFLRATVA
jgi:hypothetical protein